MPIKKRAIHQVQLPTQKLAEHPREIPNLGAIRRELARIIGAAAGEIVLAAIAKAKAGQLPAIKYLFELAGIHPPRTQDEQSGDLSLARVLCRQLGLPEESNSGEQEPSQELAASVPLETTEK